jgi:hypothetical protein
MDDRNFVQLGIYGILLFSLQTSFLSVRIMDYEKLYGYPDAAPGPGSSHRRGISPAPFPPFQR